MTLPASNLDPLPSMESPFVMEIGLRSLTQLFEPPGPLVVEPRTLHPQILDAILEQARRAPRGCPLQLVLRLPTATPAEPQEVGDSLRAYFASRRKAERHEIRRIFRLGGGTLAIGMAILIVATAIAEVIHTAFGQGVFTNVANGLEIFGWVALWRPAELLLYEWMPIYRRQRLMNRLANATIECRPAQA